MNAYAGPGAGYDGDGRSNFGRTVDEWLNRAAQEIRDGVAYVDRVIVPEVRHESGAAMRTVAGHMERWADKLDPQGARAR